MKDEYEEPTKGKSKGHALPLHVTVTASTRGHRGMKLALKLHFRGKGKEGKGKSKEDPPLRPHSHIFAILVEGHSHMIFSCSSW